MSGPAIIPFHSGKSEMLASEQPGELLYTLEQVPPNTGAGAGGAYAQGTPLTWTFKPANGKWWIPSESYLEVQMSVWGTTGDASPQVANLARNINGADTNSLQSVAPLAPACLFDSMTFECNGKTIESITTNVAQHTALRWRLSNRSEQRASGKDCLFGEPERIAPAAAPAYPTAAQAAAAGVTRDVLDSTDAVATGNVAYVNNTIAAVAANARSAACPISIGTQQMPVTQSSWDRQAVFALSRKQTLTFRLPFAIMHQNLPVPSGNFRITAQVSNQLSRALQTLTDSGATAGPPVAYSSIINSATAGATAVQIQVNNLDFYAAYADYGSSGLYNGQLVIPTNPVWLSSYALSTSSNTDQFTITGLPPTAVRYGVALQRASANSGLYNHACSPTEFQVARAIGRNGCPPNPSIVAGAQNPIFALTTLQCTIGGRVAPQPQARLAYSSAENNMHKWYRRFSDASGLEEPEEFEQWLARGPCYMFPSLQIKSPDDRATDMVVRMERDATAAAVGSDAAAAGAVDVASYAVPTNALIFAVAEKALVCECRGGEIVDVTEIDR